MDKFNARMQQKIDTYENWSKATNFIPLKGELIIYTTDENGNEKIGFKVGTGEQDKNVHQLDFVSLSEAAATVSWNDLTDKPFYETGWSIEWDGTETDESILEEAMGGTLYKLSNFVPKDEVIGAKAKIDFGGDVTEFEVTSDSVVDISENVYVVMYDGMYGVFISNSQAGKESFSGIEFDFPSSGLWFVEATGNYRAVSIDKSSLKKLDTKYLPDNIITSWNNLTDKPFGEVGTKIEWDGTPTDVYETFDADGELGYFYKVSEPVDTIIDGTAHIISIDSDTEQTLSSDIVQVTDGGENGIYIMNVKVPNSVFAHPAGVDITFKEVGLYFFYSHMDGQEAKVASFTSSDYGIKQIDKQYIPDIYLESAAAGAPNGVATLDDAGKVPLAQLPDDIGGGVTSWNDLEDKPFGETGLQIEWDGNVEGLETFNVAGAFDFYKVFSETPTKEELTGATSMAYFDGSTLEGEIGSGQTIDFLDTNNGNVIGLFGGELPMFFIVSVAGEDIAMGEIEINFPSTGVYFLRSSGTDEYTHYIQKDYSFKALDPKFIPNYFGEVGFYIDYDISKATATVTIPANEEGGSSELRYIKLAEPIDGSIKGYLLAINDNGIEERPMGDEEYDTNIFVSDAGSEYNIFVLNMKNDNEMVDMEEHYGIAPFTVPEAGLYFIDETCMGESGLLVYFKSPDYSIKQIDKKFIPDDITAAISLTFDEFPTEGSQNPVKSMGIHSAISALEGKITSTFCYKGTVANYTDLPMDGNTVGDVWNIANADESHGVEAGDNAAWDGNSWDILAGIVDLSDYYTKTEIDSIALNGTINLANYYTKAEIDDKIGDCDEIIGYINTLIGGVN